MKKKQKRKRNGTQTLTHATTSNEQLNNLKNVQRTRTQLRAHRFGLMCGKHGATRKYRQQKDGARASPTKLNKLLQQFYVEKFENNSHTASSLQLNEFAYFALVKV